MPNDLIAQSRKRFLVENPPRITEVPAFTSNGDPAGSMTIPNLNDIGIIGCKLGMEFLAICHDEDAVEEWINTALGIAQDPMVASVLFANVFRGVNVVIGTIISDAGLRDQMQKLAVDAWRRDFEADS